MAGGIPVRAISWHDRASTLGPAMIRFAIIALVLAVFSGSATAADMHFYMKNRQDHGVAVELFSQDRDKVWPGDDKVYFLDAREKKAVPVTCEAGERICYGAWINGNDRISFGVGPDNDQPPCQYCCFLCVEKSTQDISISK
jgi:hypothetical protein